MRLVSIDKLLLSRIYEDRMVNDFPPDELKPLQIMLDAIDKGIYECYGLENESSLVGYAMFVKNDEDYLVDYLAIFDEYRNRGLGGEFLKLLAKEKVNASSILVEVEDPLFAEDSEDKDLRVRRFNFYIRNGLIDTGVKALCFGVHYSLLEFKTNTIHSKEDIRELYKKRYKAILPEKMYRSNIFV